MPRTSSLGWPGRRHDWYQNPKTNISQPIPRHREIKEYLAKHIITIFDNKMKIYDEFFSIIKKLNEANIHYAVVGGIALSFHTQPRYTKDIDILLLEGDIDNLKSILKKMGYTFEANPWTFKNTNITLHRLTKIEGEDSLTIDLLVGNEGRHKEIIENAIVEETEYGLTCIASREDLIWMKRFRNSKQDIADIEALENDKNTESS